MKGSSNDSFAQKSLNNPLFPIDAGGTSPGEVGL